MPVRPRGSLTPLLFVLVSVFWGSSFLFMKVAVESFSAAQVMVTRLTLGALVLVSIMLVTRRRWPRGARTWRSLLIISVFLCVIPFTLYAWASNYIPSGLTSIYTAATPVATLILGLIVLPQEKANGFRIAGLGISALGVVVLAAPWTFDLTTNDGTLLVLAQLAALGATTCYAVAFVLTRRLMKAGEYDATTIASAQISLATIVGIILSPPHRGTRAPYPYPVGGHKPDRARCGVDRDRVHLARKDYSGLGRDRRLDRHLRRTGRRRRSRDPRFERDASLERAPWQCARTAPCNYWRPGANENGDVTARAQRISSWRDYACPWRGLVASIRR